MTPALTDIQKHLGLAADGKWGPDTARAVAAALGLSIAASSSDSYVPYTLTPRIMMELVAHEAIVPEAYLDSVGILTWGVGVTSASGHGVDRYINNPQSIARCLEIFTWLCAEKYGPDVRRAFNDQPLNEAQYAAALSFHYNTGAILRASWVNEFNVGRPVSARKAFMNWRKPREIIPRRTKERDLFFDGKWSSDGKATVYDVQGRKPVWSSARRVDITADLHMAMQA